MDTLHVVTSAIDGLTVNAGNKVCVDSISSQPFPDNALDITTKRLRRSLMTGRAVFYGATRVWDLEFRRKRFQASTPVSSFPNLPAPAWAYYSTKALANANLNQPKVDIPLFLFEMKDMPGMLRDLGRVLNGRYKPSDVPGGYLAAQFGWGPLFNDLASLLGLADQIAARKKQILKAASEGGSKIVRQLGGDPIDLGTSAIASMQKVDQRDTGSGSWTYTGTSKYWYSARLRLLTVFPDETDLDTAVFRSVLGLNLSAASIWNAIPWTWLVDYFVNVGDFLDANRGGIRYKLDRLNLMCHQHVRGEWKAAYTAPGFTQVPGTLELDYKGRRIPSLALPVLAPRPYFTDHMAYILGNLATASALRSVKL